MGYIVGSARISENGNAGWDGKAKAGDQTGKEVGTQAFYVHSKGWFVFRFKNAEHAKKAAQQMFYACGNSHIGYDQSQRGTLRLQLINNKYTSISQVTEDCETDCSALVRECIRLATGKDVGNIRTVSMPKLLPESGLFEDVKEYTSGMKLYTGDILVTKTSGHTVIVTAGETWPGASTTVKPKGGDTVEFEVKTVKAGEKGQHVKRVCAILKGLGYYSGKLTTECVAGGALENAILAYQKKRGLTQDKKFGPQCWNSFVNSGV